MYEHTIIAMIDSLVKDNVIPKAKRDDAIRSLSAYWDDKMAVVWCTNDVIERGKEKGINITEERAVEIIKEMHHRHDCEYGITWNTIDFYLTESN